MKAFHKTLCSGKWFLLVLPLVVIAYPVARVVIPEVVHAVIPEVVRAVLHAI